MTLDRRAWLEPALQSLWFLAATERMSGALGLLEPRVAWDGPSLKTDGRILWVNADTLEQWIQTLLVDAPEHEGVRALSAVGLEVLYAWRGEPGVWTVPKTGSPLVLDIEREEVKGDWLVEQFMGRNDALPSTADDRSRWWHSQRHLLGPGQASANDSLWAPPDWAQPLRIQTPQQAHDAWWQATRDWRRAQAQSTPDLEQEWMMRCLLDRVHELDDWMTISPPVALPRTGLFLLDNPLWIDAFLKQGAVAEAVFMGDTAVGKAAKENPHMLMPLLDAGVPTGSPDEELFLSLLSWQHHGENKLDAAEQAARGLMTRMAQAGRPLELHKQTSMLQALLPNSLDPNETRLPLLERLWPKGERLDQHVPLLKVPLSRKATKELPLAHAVAVLAGMAIQKKGVGLDELKPRLEALARMGVDFSHTTSHGGAFHPALKCLSSPQAVETLYFSLEPMGADWHARDRNGNTALEQRDLEKSESRKRLKQALPTPGMTAHLQEKRLEEALTKGHAPTTGTPRARL